MENDVKSKSPEKKQEVKQEVVNSVTPGKPEKSRIKQELDTPGKLMVSGIPKHEEFTEAQLEKEFAPYGRITEVNIIRDRRSSLPRGFAFITYENPQDSEDAIKAMEGKDLGGEMPIHCEQAVIGLRKTKKMTEDSRGGVRGGQRGRGIRGGDRGGRGWDRGGRGWDRGGRSRGMERGRGWDMSRGFGDRGGPRGRGMQGGPQYGGERFNEMGPYEEEEYYDESEYGDAGYEEFPQQRGNRGGMFRGGPPGRGGPMGRGGPPGRGGNFGRGAPQDRGGPPGRGRGGPPENVPMRGHDFRGGPSRRALLPNPPPRGSRGPYAGPMRGQVEEYYGEDANGYQGEEYFESGEAYEGYDDQFAEETYTSEEYYVEKPVSPRGRGGAMPRGRGRPEPLQPGMRHQVDEYGYSYEEQSVPQRVPRPQAPVQRRAPPPPQLYSEEVYEEETPDSYERPRANVPAHGAPRGGRGAPVSRGAPVVRGGPVIRGGPNGRGAPAVRGAPPGRRTALLGAEPYGDETMYKRQPAPVAGNYVGGSGYEEDPYSESYNRRPPPSARQVPVGRARPAVASGDEMYVVERPQPKPMGFVGDQPPVRNAGMGPPNRYPDYQTSGVVGREQFPDARRLPPRRVDPDIRLREDPYQRIAAETDAYVSYPPSSRVAGEPGVSDPYNRKRPIDQYEEGDVSRGMGAPVTGVKRDYREYDEYRSAQAPPKRERLDRGGVYEAYSSRQEGAYRGL